MDIVAQVKKLGRKPKISETTISLDGTPGTVRELISLTVAACVDAYNKRTVKPEQESLAEVLFAGTADDADAAAQGKISFGGLANRTAQDAGQAIDTALLAFEDGLFVVFADDESLEALDQPVRLRPGSIVTFIRLTNLTGRLW